MGFPVPYGGEFLKRSNLEHGKLIWVPGTIHHGGEGHGRWNGSGLQPTGAGTFWLRSGRIQRQEMEANPSYPHPLRLCLPRLVFEWKMSDGERACHCGQLCPSYRGAGRGYHLCRTSLGWDLGLLASEPAGADTHPFLRVMVTTRCELHRLSNDLGDKPRSLPVWKLLNELH